MQSNTATSSLCVDCSHALYTMFPAVRVTSTQSLASSRIQSTSEWKGAAPQFRRQPAVLHLLTRSFNHIGCHLLEATAARAPKVGAVVDAPRAP